jgi:hypothetical protein
MIFINSINPPSTGRGTRRKYLNDGMRTREGTMDMIRVTLNFFFKTPSPPIRILQ